MRQYTPWLFIVTLILLSACAPTAASTPEPVAPTNQPAPATQAPPTENPATATETTAPAAPPSDRITLPEGPLTIVTLGDSLTEGQGDESGINGYPPRLQTLIEPLRPGSQVLNFGKSGWTSGDLINGINGEASQLEPAIAATPNVALVWIGSNDLWYLYEYGPEPMDSATEAQDLATYEANLDTILGRLKQAGAITFIALLDDQSRRPVVAAPPNPAEPAFTATTPEDIARMAAHVSAYNEIILRKAAEYGAIPVDFFNTDIFTNPATLYGDGNHPNTAGYELITQIWFGALEPTLK